MAPDLTNNIGLNQDFSTIQTETLASTGGKAYF
uniref:Uncharacterized protein n=1 Tax=Arundo donax TaxID=35708 RepID=A0A0A8YLI8_ARUDO